MGITEKKHTYMNVYVCPRVAAPSEHAYGTMCVRRGPTIGHGCSRAFFAMVSCRMERYKQTARPTPFFACVSNPTGRTELSFFRFSPLCPKSTIGHGCSPAFFAMLSRRTERYEGMAIGPADVPFFAMLSCRTERYEGMAIGPADVPFFAITDCCREGYDIGKRRENLGTNLISFSSPPFCLLWTKGSTVPSNRQPPNEQNQARNDRG
jgi:hypothetical protein